MTNLVPIHVPPSVFDPRTMDLDDLLVATKQVYKGMRRGWLWLVAALNRIQAEKFYLRLDCATWKDYLESEFTGMGMSTIKNMQIGHRFVVGEVPEVVEEIYREGPGAEGSLAGKTSIPDYTAAVALNALKNKAAAGAIPQEDYDDLHKAAFSGEISGKEVRRRAHKLSQGIRHKRSDPKGDPDQIKVDAAEQQVALAAVAVRGVRAIVREGRANLKVLSASGNRFMAALLVVVGEEGVAAMVEGGRRFNRDGAARGRPSHRSADVPVLDAPGDRS